MNMRSPSPTKFGPGTQLDYFELERYYFCSTRFRSAAIRELLWRTKDNSKIDPKSWLLVSPDQWSERRFLSTYSGRPKIDHRAHVWRFGQRDVLRAKP